MISSEREADGTGFGVGGARALFGLGGAERVKETRLALSGASSPIS